MARNMAKAWLLGAVLMGAGGMQPAQAQAPQVGVADYERAARMLADRTAPLLDHVVSDATWLDDGTLVYRERAMCAWSMNASDNSGRS